MNIEKTDNIISLAPRLELKKKSEALQQKMIEEMKSAYTEVSRSVKDDGSWIIAEHQIRIGELEINHSYMDLVEFPSLGVLGLGYRVKRYGAFLPWNSDEAYIFIKTEDASGNPKDVNFLFKMSQDKFWAYIDEMPCLFNYV